MLSWEISVKGSACWSGACVAVVVLKGVDVSTCWAGDCAAIVALAGVDVSAGGETAGLDVGEVPLPGTVQAVRIRMQPNNPKGIIDNRFIMFRPLSYGTLD